MNRLLWKWERNDAVIDVFPLGHELAMRISMIAIGRVLKVAIVIVIKMACLMTINQVLLLFLADFASDTSLRRPFLLQRD